MPKIINPIDCKNVSVVRNDQIDQKLVAIVSKIKNKTTKCWKGKILQNIPCLKWSDYINSPNILKYSKVVIFTINLKKYGKKRKSPKMNLKY